MDIIKENPWRGLEAYQDGEILYGRDEDIKSLSQYVIDNVDTVLYGRSGIGKSSLINAGIIPAARRNGYHSLSIHLVHEGNIAKEENFIPYVQQIRNAITAANITISESSKSTGDGELIWELFHRNKFYDENGERCKLLIIFDQFEEIFTLQKRSERKRGFFSEMADMLNDIQPRSLTKSTPQKEKETQAKPSHKNASSNGIIININKIGLNLESNTNEFVDDNEVHFVFTLREDFLSDFEYYTSAIPSLKQHRYGLRPLSEEQSAEIILRPRMGLVTKEVAKLIIQKVTQRVDFELDGIPEVEVDSAVLSLYLSRLYEEKSSDIITAELVEEKGGEIISNFYLKCVEGLDDKKIEFLEDTLVNDEGRRENKSESSISKEIGQDVVNKLVGKKLLRRFSYASDMRIEFIHDILCPVIKQRKEQREQMRLQEEERARQEAERKRLLKQQLRDKKRFRRVLKWSIGGTVAMVVALLAYAYIYVFDYSEYYTSFIRQNGWPIGVGESMTEDEAQAYAVYYKLTRKGRGGSRPFESVEICSSDPIVIPNYRTPIVSNNESEDEKAAAFSLLNQQIRIIKFIGMGGGFKAGVSMETCYGADDTKPLYSINYFKTNDSGSKGHSYFVWAVFCDANGQTMQVRDNGADRMRIQIDENGREVKYMFFDAIGSPRSNYLNCYGFAIDYDGNDNRVAALCHLNQFGDTIVVEKRQYEGRKTYMSYYGQDGTTPILFLNRFHRRVSTTNSHGLVDTCYYYDMQDKLLSGANAAIEINTYDNHNRLVRVDRQNGSRKPLSISNGKDTYSYATYKYVDDKSNNLIEEIRYFNNEPVFSNVIRNNGRGTMDIRREDIYRHLYKHERIVKHGDTEEHTFLSQRGVPIVDAACRYSRKVVRSKTIGSNTLKVTKVYDEKGALCNEFNSYRNAAIDSTLYNATGQPLWQFRFDRNGSIVMALGYEYNDGVESCRYVLSLDGKTPIRCPRLEPDGMSYYKLREVRNFVGVFPLAYIEAESEYAGCSSYVEINNDNYTFKVDSVPTPMGAGWTLQNLLRVSFKQLPTSVKRVAYLHITDLKGLAYKAGVRDGDLLLSCNDWHYSPSAMLPSLFNASSQQRIEVLRYSKKQWERKTFVLSNGQGKGVECYLVPYTDDEYEFFKKGLAKQ